MGLVVVTCMNCGREHVQGQGQEPWEGYLPGNFTSETCYVCRPDLDGKPEK